MAVAPNGDIVAVGSQITFSQSGVATVNGLARPEEKAALLAAATSRRSPCIYPALMLALHADAGLQNAGTPLGTD